MHEPIISVIVPIYNTEKYLHKCIASILGQTYSKLQVILVDDGATDTSAAICDTFLEKDDRVECIHLKEKKGQSNARKQGLLHAKGEYIGFVDSDDWIEPDMYENLISKIVSFGADIICSGIIYEYENGSSAVVSIDEEIINDPRNNTQIFESLLGMSIGQYYNVSMCTKLYKKELVTKAAYDIPEYVNRGEDRLANLICLFESKRIININEAYYHYRKHSSSTSHSIRASDVYEISGFFGKAYSILLSYNADEHVFKCLKDGFISWMIPAMKEGLNVKLYYPRYRINNVTKYDGEKVIIYGGGSVGASYYEQLLYESHAKIMACVDQNPSNCESANFDVKDVLEINNVKYDHIIIAVAHESVAKNIEHSLIDMYGVDASKIVWEQPNDDR